MMSHYNHDRDIPNTKQDCSSPATTRSESYSRNGRNKAEEHDDIISPVSASRRSTDVRGIIAPSRRDQQLMRQVSGLDLDDFDKTDPLMKEAADDEGGIILTGPASEIGGIIAPTNRQRQLMRQVSGLGLEDPIFGKNLNLDDSITKEHASFFFEDMDINDIPEDMRDMFSLASDRTDVVDTDNDVQSYDSKSFGSLPPLGLEENAVPATKKKLRKGKKPRSKSRDKSGGSVTSDPNYVPPAPVFVAKRRASRSERGDNRSVTSHDRALAVDKALAAQVDAILSINESKNSRDFSSHSRGSYTGHSRTSHTGHSRALKKGTRPKPRRQDSRFSVSSYVPPSMHSDGMSQRGERHMPESMDEIFAKTPSSSRRVKKKKSTRSTEEKKKKKKAKGKPLKAPVPKDPDWEVS
mmetsp:Transcript_9251/g.22985  ORF Transcript_9251/g.22985 Transcript_9251/m.22985 type:complete len:409 (+) Transcript_9251:261-1487(+)